jgi:hypothetical protein
MERERQRGELGKSKKEVRVKDHKNMREKRNVKANKKIE